MSDASKKEFRRKIRAVRDRLTGEEVLERSAEISDRISKLPEFIRAKRILCYMSFRNEVNCNDIMLTAREEGKEIYLPRMEGEEMTFYRASDRLVRNELGIYEPFPEDPLDVSDLTDAFMIMPGLVFQKNGMRLGYGGGFYDRFLSEHPVFAAAAAYGFQVIDDTFPTEETDIPADVIVTENEIYRKEK